MKKTIYSISVLAAMALTGVQDASADVTAVYKMTSQDGDGTQSIRYADKQHVRMDMVSVRSHETTMLKLGDKVYMINGKTVQDMDQLAGMMAMMGKGSKTSHKKQAAIKYHDTGRTETVAGLVGKVYSFEERGKRHEVVLAKNKDLQAAVLGLVELTKAMTGASDSPMNRVQEDASIKSMALLRLDDVVRLHSMNKKGISKSVFVLPAKPQQMGGMGSLLNGLLGR